MELNEITKLFEALSHERRITIMLLLLDSKESLHSAAIAHVLNLPEANTSFHLKKLEAVGLVTSAKAGKYTLYSANVRRFLDLVNTQYQLAQGVVHETGRSSEEPATTATEDLTLRLSGDQENDVCGELGE